MNRATLNLQIEAWRLQKRCNDMLKAKSFSQTTMTKCLNRLEQVSNQLIEVDEEEVDSIRAKIFGYDKLPLLKD